VVLVEPVVVWFVPFELPTELPPEFELELCGPLTPVLDVWVEPFDVETAATWPLPAVLEPDALPPACADSVLFGTVVPAGRAAEVPVAAAGALLVETDVVGGTAGVVDVAGVPPACAADAPVPFDAAALIPPKRAARAAVAQLEEPTETFPA
jgi:hypothetical protein